MNNLKEKRTQAGAKQSEIAEFCGVSQQMVSHWETGRKELLIRNAKKIAEFLGCRWKDLYPDE